MRKYDLVISLNGIDSLKKVMRIVESMSRSNSPIKIGRMSVRDFYTFEQIWETKYPFPLAEEFEELTQTYSVPDIDQKTGDKDD